MLAKEIIVNWGDRVVRMYYQHLPNGSSVCDFYDYDYLPAPVTDHFSVTGDPLELHAVVIVDVKRGNTACYYYFDYDAGEEVFVRNYT